MANSTRSKHSNSVDRISALPKELICHILSQLPTNFAIQTSIVSKKWKDLWTSITSLEFDEDLFLGHDEEVGIRRFKHFVYMTLVLLKTKSLQKFYLHSLNMRDPFIIHTWVCAALSRDVQELTLDIFVDPVPFELPLSLFRGNMLSCLSLNSDTMLDVPRSVFLPNLMNLHLCMVRFANEDSFPSLLSGCPRLQVLWVQRLDFDNVLNFNVSSSSLQQIILDFEIDILPDSPPHTLQINAPRARHLNLIDHVSDTFVIANMPSLVEAKISVHASERNNDANAYGDQVVELLIGLSNVKFLSLSGGTMEALSLSFAHHEHIAPPAFHNLLSCLTRIEIRGFDDSVDEVEMVKFMLKGAKALEKMTIITRDLETEEKLNLVQRLIMFPRESNICEFEFR